MKMKITLILISTPRDLGSGQGGEKIPFRSFSHCLMYINIHLHSLYKNRRRKTRVLSSFSASEKRSQSYYKQKARQRGVCVSKREMYMLSLYRLPALKINENKSI